MPAGLAPAKDWAVTIVARAGESSGPPEAKDGDDIPF
jgi:hypothetical protein